MPSTNAELDRKIDQIETLLDDMIQALNAMPTSTTLNAAVLSLQTQLDTLQASVASLQNSVTTLQNIIISEP